MLPCRNCPHGVYLHAQRRGVSCDAPLVIDASGKKIVSINRRPLADSSTTFPPPARGKYEEPFASIDRDIWRNRATMDTPHVVIMAVVQGLTEFLPVSSSGHLVIGNEVLKALDLGSAPDLLSLNIMLHLGTLLAVVLVYRNQIWQILTTQRNLIGKILVACIPAGLVGVPLHEIESLKSALESPLLAAWLLPITGAILLFGRSKQGETSLEDVTYRQALGVGIAQAIAILPGISRSGSSIVAGLCLGLKRDAAAAFSFLISIPVVGGAVLLDARELLEQPTSDVPWGQLFIGVAVAFAVGIFALKALIHWLTRGKLHRFAWWCIPVGIIAGTWLLLR